MPMYLGHHCVPDLCGEFTISVNSPHKARRSGVVWLLEFLFTPIIPLAMITLRYLGCGIQHFVPNFSGVCHHKNICQF
jgi:hypothetical protein